ncbi:hypothetical protein OKJ48_26940 [Streptomyces kunmingensis]|uniref:LPXTG-motif cell wall anchor domain-containing protein n=1 Tax=Streptomyces kunmingensis TaxID=68225 RepID=A0ABU6CI14_9ACTN|nr:hypothetical protein [Streptomyces kunmingensis]MEB3963846.1 hypothetical protein [Streptomyces kunmingensis]
MSRQRRAGAAGCALILSGAGLWLAAAPAHAAESSFKTECIPPAISGLPPVEGTTVADITAPATAKVGDEIDVVWKTTQAASKNPDVLDLDADTVQPTGTVKLGGAQTGDLKMEGPRKNPAIPKNSPMVLSDMTGKLKLTKAGDVTLTPDAYTINVNKPISTDTKCTPKETVEPAVTIKVTDGGGASTGGTAAGGTATGGTTAGGTTTSGSTGGSTSGSTGGSTGGSTSGSAGGSTGGGDGKTDFTGKEVSIPYACKTPIGDKNATSPVQINAKKDGGNYALTVKFGASVMDSPADIPADSVKPSMAVKLGGADKGTVNVEGPTNKDPIKSGDPMTIPDLTGTYKPGADGKSTLSPGVLTVKALGTTTTCTPTKTEVSLEIDTTAVEGGATGGSGSGSAGGSTGNSAGGSDATGGGLAETGASNDGALRALGLVAGTVILLGGAVFTFLPKRRAARGR